MGTMALNSFRSLPESDQKSILQMGPLEVAKNPTALLTARVTETRRSRAQQDFIQGVGVVMSSQEARAALALKGPCTQHEVVTWLWDNGIPLELPAADELLIIDPEQQRIVVECGSLLTKVDPKSIV